MNLQKQVSLLQKIPEQPTRFYPYKEGHFIRHLLTYASF